MNNANATLLTSFTLEGGRESVTVVRLDNGRFQYLIHRATDPLDSGAACLGKGTTESLDDLMTMLATELSPDDLDRMSKALAGNRVWIGPGGSITRCWFTPIQVNWKEVR